MELFGARYQEIRQQFIFPLIKYSVTQDKLDYNNIKGIINGQKIKNAQVAGNNRFKLYFNEDDVLKAIIGEIEFFYIRTLEQWVNLNRVASSLSPSWGFVTQYYFSFFAATVFLRLLHRGSVYLNTQQTNILTQIISVLSGDIVKLSAGNYTFVIEKDPNSNEFILEIATTNLSAHEQTWILVNEAILEMISKPLKKDDEHTLLTEIKNIADFYGAKFPSEMRNIVNYQAPYGLKSIMNGIPHFPKCYERDQLIKEVMKFERINEEGYKLNYVAVYGYYFFLISTKLFSELQERGHPCPKLQKNRKEYIKKYNCKLPKV